MFQKVNPVKWSVAGAKQFHRVNPKVSFPKMEEDILKFWDAEKIFEKSVENRQGKPLYSFYDGPPFATGTPHYGHIVASTIKDAVPRYWTMKGYQVPRRWGWDTHGLPIENIAEKELGITHKKEILELGVAKFNEVCRSKVLEYVDEWKKVIHRFGRWADMDNAYSTMDLSYMESVWWAFKELWDKGLIYESYRSMHICPRCETTLSQSEVAEGYKDVKDLAVVAKFELVDDSSFAKASDGQGRIFVLAWTTTPWTLPGNVALAVNKDIEYVKVQGKNESFILAKETLAKYLKDFGEENPKITEEFTGEKLLGKSYKPLFDYYSNDSNLENRENGWKIYHADFVTTDMGTGIAHEAPAFGEEDMELGKKEKLPFVQHVNMDGTMKEAVADFAGRQVKPKENPQEIDVEIIKYLAKKGLLFSKEKYEHSYPHCWRCDTPLLNYATTSWFVKVTDIKEKALDLAKDIHWSPEHIKEGRFGKWLEGARDWSISRQRFWASVMPLWKCECGEMRVFGSVRELEDASGKTITDLHKHIVDEITVPCEKCQGVMKRIPDVLDTWFDSGSMPYAQSHYPFENKEQFERSFPAQFIAEGIDQTRAWFYYLHVMGTSLKEKNAFQNVIVNGVVLAEDGKKMSKRLQNYPDPMEIINKYGSDALRLYLLSSPVVAAENLNFSEKGLSDISRNVFRMLWNSYSFFVTYAAIDKWECKKDVKPSQNLLDRWILSELQILIKGVDASMEKYELLQTSRQFMPFIDNLSNWYIRRSRKRFWKSEDDSDKENAYQTLYDVLVTLSKLMAPFTPFISEEIYKNLTGKESVHLEDFPKADESLIDDTLNQEMGVVRSVVSVGLQLRVQNNTKVRQPLLATASSYHLRKELEDIITEELNVKEYIFEKDSDMLQNNRQSSWKKNIISLEVSETIQVTDNFFTKLFHRQTSSAEPKKTYVALNVFIPYQLKLEGEAREIIRAVQEGRKKAGFNVEDRIILAYVGKDTVFANEELKNLIAKEVLATQVEKGDMLDADYHESVNIEGEEFTLSLKRV